MIFVIWFVFVLVIVMMVGILICERDCGLEILFFGWLIILFVDVEVIWLGMVFIVWLERVDVWVFWMRVIWLLGCDNVELLGSFFVRVVRFIGKDVIIFFWIDEFFCVIKWDLLVDGCIG